MNRIESDEDKFWLQYRRYPYLLAKFTYFAVLAVLAWTMLSAVSAVLVPVLFSMLLAYILDPAVDWFEDRGFSRTTGIALFVALSIGIVLLFALFLLPTISVIVRDVGIRVPALLDFTEASLLPWLEESFGVQAPATVSELFEDLGQQASDYLPDILSTATASLSEALNQTGAIASSLLNLLLIPFLTFYFLRDFDIMKDAAVDYLPVKSREWLLGRLREMDKVVGAWVRGQIEVGLILGLMYGVGLGVTFGIWDIGILSGVAIGMVSGLLNVIPYLGFAIGFLLALLLALLEWHGWGPIVGVLATFGIAQTIEGYIVTPRIVGDKVGLSPVVIIIALLLGYEVLGILGVLLAIPIVGSFRVLLPDLIQLYKRSDLFLGELSPAWGGASQSTESITSNETSTEDAPVEPTPPT